MNVERTTLFCWSGGGLPGLDIHVGIWQALSDLGIEATANAGTSAGAIMAALNSNGMTAVAARRIIGSLSDSDVRSERFAWKVRIPWISYFLENEPIRKLLEANLPAYFTDLKKPLHVFCTAESSGVSWSFSDGQLIDRILGSMAICGVFPPVAGLTDGGTSADLPLPPGWQKFDQVYLLIAARPIDYRGKDSILTRLMFNADLFMEGQIQRTIADAKAIRPDVHVIRPLVRAPRGGLHFDHALIAESEIFTKMILANAVERALRNQERRTTNKELRP